MRLIKGSHIITRQLFAGDHSYIIQNADGRIIFAIPYEHEFTLIGTTDVPYHPSDGPAKISQDEIDYLLSAANEYFDAPITQGDIVSDYSGVRPLYDDKAKSASEVTRDYVLEVDEFAKGAPFLSVFGGKITTSRKLAEHALQKLEDYFTYSQLDWTAKASLPGGDIQGADFESFFKSLSAKYPKFNSGILYRMARCYGTKTRDMIGDAQTLEAMGRNFGGGLTQREADYLVKEEFATRAEDILNRRTKLALHMGPSQIAAFTNWFKQEHGHGHG